MRTVMGFEPEPTVVEAGRFNHLTMSLGLQTSIE